MPDVLILCYHAVSDKWPAALSITPERLQRQVELLLRRGYVGRALSEAVAAPPLAPYLVVTFDDAFKSVIDRAFPLLRELGVPATVFVPTAHAGRPEPMSWPGIDHWVGTPYESELAAAGWEELEALTQAGWEIGSHTRTHRRLTTLDDDALREELQGSRGECERRLGLPCRTVAYPYGEYDARVTSAAEDAGYDLAVTLPARLHAEEPFNWPRVGIYHVDTGWRFRLKVSPVVRQLRASAAWRGVDAVRAARTRIRPEVPSARA